LKVIANWKQNKEPHGLKLWVEEFVNSISDVNRDRLPEIVIAPPFTMLESLRLIFSIPQNNEFGVKFAAQDVSEFQDEAHTGEVGAKQLAGLVDYVIIGHSETRLMGETPENINDKIENAISADLKCVVCFGNIRELEWVRRYQDDRDNSMIVYAYEPVESIGTGSPSSPDNVREIFDKSGLGKVIYGGSVDKSNVSDYLSLNFVDGFLVGGASLDSREFAGIVVKVALNNEK
jgi:triosephosphate isomerase